MLVRRIHCQNNSVVTLSKNILCFSWVKDVNFDLVLYESMWATPYLALVHKIGSPPVIGIVTMEKSIWFDYAMGCPADPAYVPAVPFYSDHMTFFQRIVNIYYYFLFLYYSNW